MATPSFTPSHEYADIFSLHEDDLPNLAKRITANGLREPCVLLDGKMLDGRRRERACHRAGIKPTFREFGSRKSDGDDPLEFVIDLNLHRRHLGEGERALAAARYATAKAGKPKSSQVETITPTNAEAADKFDVSEQKVDRAKKVVVNGTPALQEAVADETITVSDAAKVADEPAKVQDEAVGKVREGKAKSAKAAAKKIKDETPCEREPGEEVEQVKDAVGFVVPFKALRAFDDAKKINAICKELDGVIARVEEIGKAPGGRMLHTTSQTQTLQQVRKSLWAGRATHVCPYCKGEKKKCDPCKDTGWLDKVGWKNAPEGLRNEMEAAK